LNLSFRKPVPAHASLAIRGWPRSVPRGSVRHHRQMSTFFRPAALAESRFGPARRSSPPRRSAVGFFGRRCRRRISSHLAVSILSADTGFHSASLPIVQPPRCRPCRHRLRAPIHSWEGPSRPNAGHAPTPKRRWRSPSVMAKLSLASRSIFADAVLPGAFVERRAGVRQKDMSMSARRAVTGRIEDVECRQIAEHVAVV